MQFYSTLTRRAVLFGTAAVFASPIMTTRLFAQNVEDDSADQAECIQSYDAATS